MLITGVASIYILANIYMLIRIIKFMSVIHERLKHPAVWTAVIVVYVAFMTAPLTGYLIEAEPYHRLLMRTGNIWLGVVGTAIAVTAIMDIARIILNRTVWKDDWPSEKRHRIGGAAAGVIIFCICFYGLSHGTEVYTNSQSINLKGQAGEVLDGMRIVLIADTHFGYNTDMKHVKKIVDEVNRADADMVVIAGDIFDNSYDAMNDPDGIAAELAEMKSTYGTYACWGNHDIPEKLLAGFTVDSGRHTEDGRFYDFLEKADIKMLEDEKILIDGRFWLVGRQDPAMSVKLGTERMTPDEILEGTQDRPVIVMDHQPSELEELAAAGADIDLSGHTHNGQIFPGTLTVKIPWKNPYGVMKIDGMYSCVTSGAGLWGPPMRIGTDCEVMVIDINGQEN